MHKLLDTIRELQRTRESDDNQIVKIGIDGGGGFFKDKQYLLTWFMIT